MAWVGVGARTPVLLFSPDLVQKLVGPLTKPLHSKSHTLWIHPGYTQRWCFRFLKITCRIIRCKPKLVATFVYALDSFLPALASFPGLRTGPGNKATPACFCTATLLEQRPNQCTLSWLPLVHHRLVPLFVGTRLGTTPHCTTTGITTKTNMWN